MDHDRRTDRPSCASAVRYGNRGLTALTAATLDVPLPAGTNHLGNGWRHVGQRHGDVGRWATCAAGANGVREMIVEVDSNAGEAIAAQAMLASGIEEAVAQTVARSSPRRISPSASWLTGARRAG